MGVLGVVAAGAAFLFYRPAPESTPPAVQPWPVGDLPKHLYRSGQTGLRVRVAFQMPLQPTADPLVFLYHPGWPPRTIPPTYRVHFDSPPTLPAGAVVVEGTAERIEPDDTRRLNGVPGLLVLRGAAPARP